MEMVVEVKNVIRQVLAAVLITFFLLVHVFQHLMIHRKGIVD
jgi:hypothetical protein